MKVVITSTGDSLEAKIDPRFGRCSYFVIYDTSTGVVEFLPNTNKEAELEAGPASIDIITSRKVEKIVSGEFGVKIKPMLDSLKMQMIVIGDPDKTIREIIELLNNSGQRSN